MGSCSSTLYLITHMGGALSSIPLCSRARQPAEADIGEADLEKRPGPVNQETICTQPQVVEKTQTQDSETCINNEKEDSKEENEANDESKEENDPETFRKHSPELDTAAAITNILSEIVGDNKDSRVVVGR